MARTRSKSGTRPSIHSVAAYAGVSIATVSKVMHGDPTIRPENVKSVQNAIEALGYRINPLAAELRRGRRKLIGAIVPNFDDPFLAGLLSALERQAETRGYGLTTTSSRDSEAREVELVNRMEDWRVAGVVIVPVRTARGAAATLLKESGLATVFVDRIAGNNGFDTVSADSQAALERVAEEVAGLGHRAVLVPHREAAAIGRFSPAVQLREALERRGGGMRVDLLNCAGTRERLAGKMSTAFGRKARPTAVLAFHEPAVMFALNESRRRNWTVPKDLSLFSFQPAPWMQFYDPPIGVAEQPAERMAERAVEFLFRRIERATDPTSAVLEACHVDFRGSLDRVPS